MQVDTCDLIGPRPAWTNRTITDKVKRLRNRFFRRIDRRQFNSLLCKGGYAEPACDCNTYPGFSYLKSHRPLYFSLMITPGPFVMGAPFADVMTKSVAS